MTDQELVAALDGLVNRREPGPWYTTFIESRYRIALSLVTSDKGVDYLTDATIISDGPAMLVSFGQGLKLSIAGNGVSRWAAPYNNWFPLGIGTRLGGGTHSLTITFFDRSYGPDVTHIF